jgi:Domain of unknown function (DUF4136)
MRFSRALIFICLLLLCPTLAQAQKVSVEYDGAGDFSRYKTYCWKPGVYAKNPYVNQQIITALDAQLQARGLRKVEEGADLHVSYYAVMERGLEVSRGDSTGAPAWVGPGGGSVGSQAWEVDTGALVVGLFDASTGKSVWRGTAKQTLDDEGSRDLKKQAKKVEKPIRKAIEKMFKKFPAVQPAEKR